jgi:hypothetical protein
MTSRAVREGQPPDGIRIRHVTTFAVTTNEYAGNGYETAEHHAVVVWD